MVEQPVLSEREWQIVLELLEAERQELHPELRRTEKAGLHEQLEGRLNPINSLLQKLQRQVSE